MATVAPCYADSITHSKRVIALRDEAVAALTSAAFALDDNERLMYPCAAKVRLRRALCVLKAALRTIENTGWPTERRGEYSTHRTGGIKGTDGEFWSGRAIERAEGDTTLAAEVTARIAIALGSLNGDEFNCRRTGLLVRAGLARRELLVAGRSVTVALKLLNATYGGVC